MLIVGGGGGGGGLPKEQQSCRHRENRDLSGTFARGRRTINRDKIHSVDCLGAAAFCRNCLFATERHWRRWQSIRGQKLHRTHSSISRPPFFSRIPETRFKLVSAMHLSHNDAPKKKRREKKPHSETRVNTVAVPAPTLKVKETYQ